MESLRDSSGILKIILSFDFITVLNTRGVPLILTYERIISLGTAERFHQTSSKNSNK